MGGGAGGWKKWSEQQHIYNLKYLTYLQKTHFNKKVYIYRPEAHLIHMQMMQTISLEERFSTHTRQSAEAGYLALPWSYSHPFQ